MAYREVESDENYQPKTYLKMAELFGEVGDSFVGLYQKDEPGEYGQDYTFKLRDGSIGVLTVKGALRKDLEKAAQIEPFALNERIEIIFRGEKDIGKASPMRLFKVKVGKPPAAKPAPAPAQDDFA